MAKTSPAKPVSAVSMSATDALGPDADLPARMTAMIVDNVGAVRDKTTGPALNIARYVLFGAFAISLGTVALLILVIGGVRLLNNYLPDAVFGEEHTWAAHSLLGLVLLLAGLTLFKLKAKRKPARS